MVKGEQEEIAEAAIEFYQKKFIRQEEVNNLDE